MTQGKRRLIAEAERANPVQIVHIWRSPARADGELLIVTPVDVYARIHEHAIFSLPNETGGFLLGRVSFAPDDRIWHLVIDEALPVEPTDQDPAHFGFGWQDVDRVRRYRGTSGKALVGWYHTHPDFGIFLSETDLERTHRILFAEPFQVALVYDPVRGRAGYFYWEAPQLIDPSQADWREFGIAVQPDESASEEAVGNYGPEAPSGGGQS